MDTEGSTALLVATNGNALLALGVESDPGDVDGVIAPEALQAAIKASEKGATEACLNCEEDSVVVHNGGNEQKFSRQRSDAFPKWREAIVSPNENPAKRARICFDPRILMDIYKALGGGGKSKAAIVIEFDCDANGNAELGPVHVEAGWNAPTHIAVLMPCRET